MAQLNENNFRRLRRYFTGKSIVVPDSRNNTVKIKSVDPRVTAYNPYWRPTNKSMYGSYINYKHQPYQRLYMFREYQLMEKDPIIARSLDILSEEACLKDEYGEVIQVECNNEDIKITLEHLFYEILNVDFALRSWTRGMLKFGDFFLYLNIKEKLGVVDVIPLSTADVEREEDEETGEVTFSALNIFKSDIPEERMAHFRLTKETEFLPYGTCLKYNTRITTTDGVKLIKDINTNDEVLVFDYKTQKMVPSKVLDVVNSGKKPLYKIRTRHNILEASKEHKIMVFNGSEFSYKYPEDLQKGDLLVINNKFNHSESTIKIDKTPTPDNKNGYWNNINKIPDYVNEEFAEFLGFMFGDGWINGNNICFALSNQDIIDDKYVKYLKSITNNKLDFRENKQVRVCDKALAIILQRLEFEGNVYEKRIPSWIFSANKNIKDAFLTGIINADGSFYIDEWDVMRINIELSNEELINDIKYLVQSLGYKSGKISSRQRKNVSIEDRNIENINESFYFYFFKSDIKQWKKYDHNNRLSDDYYLFPIEDIEYDENSKEDVYDIHVENENHNFVANGVVVHNSHLEPVRKYWKMLTLLEDFMMVYYLLRSVNQRVFRVDVGGLTRPQAEQYVQKVREMFKKTPLTDEKTGEYDLKYDPLTMIDDIVLPVRQGYDNTTFDEIPASTETDIVSGIDYLRQKMMAGLGVPNFLLNYEETINSKSTASSEDIRFSKTVEGIQKVMIDEITKIAVIHLILQGYSKSEIFSFDLSLTPPSDLREMEKLEKIRTRLDIARDAKDSELFDLNWIYKNIMNLGEDEIEDIREGLVNDKISQQMQDKSIEQATEEGLDVQEPAEPTVSPEAGAGAEEAPDTGTGSEGGLEPKPTPDAEQKNSQEGRVDQFLQARETNDEPNREPRSDQDR